MYNTEFTHPSDEHRKLAMIPLIKTRMPSRDRLLPELEKVLYSGYVAQGEIVETFERSFERFVGGGNSLSVNSGTAALHVAMILAGVRSGDEVISTALTAEPTNVAIKMAGGTIRYADVDRHTTNISARSIAEKINDRTRAIVVVDYAGIPVDVDNIKRLAATHGLPVIHDAAHSLGSKVHGGRAGTHFEYTAFSFQAIKHITTIDGGMLQILAREKYEEGKLIRWFGIDKNTPRLLNNISIQGYKYHMNNVNAAIGIVQLETIEQIISSHIANGKFFDQSLSGITGIELLSYYPFSEPSYWIYTLLADDRKGLIRKLGEHSICASELHKRNDLHSFLNDFHEELPVLDAIYPRLLHIPCGWWLSAEDRERIVEVIKSGW